jgi:hypothetical protein
MQLTRLFVLGAFLSLTSASAQEVRTQGQCSPVVRTQGNVTITFSGGCTVGITPAELTEIIDSVLARRAIPPELLDRYEMVSRQLGVTDTALETFFRILGEKKIATEDLDAKLREVAARHITLLRRTEASADDDPQFAMIKRQWRQLLRAIMSAPKGCWNVRLTATLLPPVAHRMYLISGFSPLQRRGQTKES